MTQIDTLSDDEPAAKEGWQGSLGQAMTRRDVELESAVAALRAAADATVSRVEVLMSVATPDARPWQSLLPAATPEAPPRKGFISLAEQLQEIALQLHTLEASVRWTVERHRRQLARDE